jgi:hypothetical protein
MAKFHVYGAIVGTKYLGIYEAETKEEAVEKAMADAAGPCLCHECSSEVEDPEIESAMADPVEE